MRLARLLAPLPFLLLLPVFGPGCEGESVSEESSDATSCKGAKRDAKGRCRLPNGRFAKASCCAAPVELCEPKIAAAIDACVASQQEDPDFDSTSTTGWDLYAQCADPEITAPARDELCASDAPPELCELDMEAFALEYLPTCRAEATHRWLDESCVFGERYGDLFGRSEAMVVLSQRQLTSASQLSSLEQAQILSAIEATAHEVSTVAEAFEVVDDNVIFLTELWDASGRRAFTAFEMGAGDNSFGKIFAHGTSLVASTINDGDLGGCEAKWGNERRRCERNEDCRGGSTCLGQSDSSPLGRCIDASLDTHVDEGDACTLSETDPGCPGGSGLLCAGAAVDGEGLCLPAWMRGRFDTSPELAIPDNRAAGAEAQLLAYGLATVDMDVKLDLSVSHPHIGDLRVVLENPAGAQVVVFEGTPSDVGAEIYLEGRAIAGFSGDESVNGVWRVRVIDRKSGQTGTLHRFGLELTSRWD